MKLSLSVLAKKMAVYVVGLMIMSGFLYGCYLHYSWDYTKMVQKVHRYFLGATSGMGFRLEHLYLEGNHRISKEEILKVTGLALDQPILGISPGDLVDKISNMSWTDKVVVERQLPNAIHIHISERIAVALWQRDGHLFLVDKNMVIIDAADLKPFADFLIMVGDEAPLHVSTLLATISKNNDLFSKINAVVRVGERRWNIFLKNGCEIKLPEYDSDKAWHYVELLFSEGKLDDGSAKIVDLRIPGKLYVRNESVKTINKLHN
jgi:cell division protein FtsQ